MSGIAVVNKKEAELMVHIETKMLQNHQFNLLQKYQLFDYIKDWMFFVSLFDDLYIF